MRSALRLGLAVLGAALVASGPALAITGQVTDPEGKPIAGAKACLLLAELELLCVTTGEAGYFELTDTEVAKLRVSADGFLPRTVAAVTQESPIALDRAASLRLRLVAAGGEPIPDGEVLLLYSTGRQVGPLPVNASGLRVRTVVPGEVRVLARAPGHRPSPAREVVLVAGRESEVVIELAPDPDSPAESGERP